MSRSFLPVPSMPDPKTPQQFIEWLKGFSAAVNKKPEEWQWDKVMFHLNRVQAAKTGTIMRGIGPE